MSAPRTSSATDTVEGLLRELIEDREFQPGGGYRFRACPFCGVWLSHNQIHHAGGAQSFDGPIVCWLVRARRLLGYPEEKRT